MIALPIDDLKDQILTAYDGGTRRFVISAPTGSGKSTRLPVFFSEKSDGRVLVLQPRRVAARMLAKAVGSLFGMQGQVGWHVRMDKHYDESTKIVFLTEGILARMLLSNPKLDGVSAVIFDEFHERNIYSDISLALALRAQESVRPDLCIAVCSASMDSDRLREYLGETSKRFECGTRLFPIETEYAPPRMQGAPVWDCAVREFERLMRQGEEGNFLIFMPGAYEIGRTVSRLMENPHAKGMDVFALHGDLPPQMQDKILAPSERRKVIVSTNVAETSLTIDGVRVVIDSGLARVARFDPARGVNTLLVERISLASATQRAGRAGRTAPGRAVRLWRQGDEIAFDRFTAPEIRRLDLSQTLLWLKSAGLDFSSLKMFEPPPDESVARAVETLKNLGAVGADGNVTRLGRAMTIFPAEPRFARLLMDGARRGCLRQISLIAALTEVGRIKLPLGDAFRERERDELVGDVSGEPEELARLCEIARDNSFKDSFCRDYGIHGANARKACVYAADLERLARRHVVEAPDGESLSDAIAKCVLSAFSDHLCVRMNKGTLACRIAGGRSGEVRKESRAYAENIFVAMDLQEQNKAGGVSILASMITPVKEEFLAELFPDDFSEAFDVRFDEKNKRVVSQKSVKFRDLSISESASHNPPPDEAAKILRDEILSGRLPLKNFDEEAEAFIERVNFVAAVCPETGIQPIDEQAKAELFEQMCCGLSSYAEVKNADVHAALREWLSHEQLGLLKYLAPRIADFPKRKRPAYIRYESSTKRAVISSFFKDFYDFDANKLRICDGKVKPTFEILAPNGRPIQTTQNLEEFWKTSWLQIKKELKARYPKHFKDERA